MRYCMKCGTANNDSMVFCISCGSPLGDASAAHRAAAPSAYTTPVSGVRCSCGYVNSASQRYCMKCGQPLNAPAYAPNAQTVNPVHGVDARKKKGGPPVAAITVLAIVAVLVIGAVVYCALNGVPDLPFLPSSSQQSPDADDNVQRVPSNAVNPVVCSSKTKIVPVDPDGKPFESYSVQISNRSGGSMTDTELRISGTGGFTMDDFNDPKATSAQKLKDGTYEITMTEDKGRRTCVLRVDYRQANTATVDVVEVMATS